MRIHRYQIEMVEHTLLPLPLGAEVLSVAPGRGGYHVDLWAKVPEVAPSVEHDFYVVGTGHKLPREANVFIGTCVMNDGYVWHVWTHERDRS